MFVFVFCVFFFLFFFLDNFFGIFTYFVALTLSRKCFNGQGMLRTSVSDSGSDKKEKKKKNNIINNNRNDSCWKRKRKGRIRRFLARQYGEKTQDFKSVESL